jgi:hypothetical protein
LISVINSKECRRNRRVKEILVCVDLGQREVNFRQVAVRRNNCDFLDSAYFPSWERRNTA